MFNLKLPLSIYYYIYTRARAKSTRAQVFLLFRRTIIRVKGNLLGVGAEARECARVLWETRTRVERVFFFWRGLRKSQKIQSVSKKRRYFIHTVVLFGDKIIRIIIIKTMIMIIKRMSEDEVLCVPRDYVFAVVLFLRSCVSSPRISIRLASAWKTTRDGEEEKRERERERHTHTTRRHAKTMCTLYLPLLFSLFLSLWLRMETAFQRAHHSASTIKPPIYFK